ncbi:MAG: DNA-processing protein DprA [Planctomycetes bacterium]|nr:DNA-processing protein DprA [Planctomycetota bacterium]
MPVVAIVGSRQASELGLARARRLARFLSDHRVIVMSGLAEGIDTAAHRTTIDSGGRTIAVLGTPLDECFPAKNRALQHEIMESHLAVSQFASGARTGRHSFPLRNRTMALLSDATVIVEARDGSGTLHQGWEALRLGRMLWITKSLFENPALRFPRELEAYGAEILDESSLNLLLDQLQRDRRDRAAEVPF